MADLDPGELVSLSTSIMELSLKLKSLRDQRDLVAKQITELETELIPLLTKHSSIVASISGMAAPTPPVVVYAPPSPVQQAPMGAPEVVMSPVSVVMQDPEIEKKKRRFLLRKKIVQYLENAESGTSALQVAEAIGAPDLEVRSIMSELMARGN